VTCLCAGGWDPSGPRGLARARRKAKPNIRHPSVSGFTPVLSATTPQPPFQGVFSAPIQHPKRHANATRAQPPPSLDTGDNRTKVTKPGNHEGLRCPPCLRTSTGRASRPFARARVASPAIVSAWVACRAPGNCSAYLSYLLAKLGVVAEDLGPDLGSLIRASSLGSEARSLYRRCFGESRKQQQSQSAATTTGGDSSQACCLMSLRGVSTTASPSLR
jgi:hypothetical protein